ncbi:MAG: amidohydrolase family protein [Burkholderiales bacterium]|nr:amidohydrolase family protein [Burkholderiales bacterium]
MRAINSHFHWYPKSVFEALCRRTAAPRASRDPRGGYQVTPHEGVTRCDTWDEWFDLEARLDHMDKAAQGAGIEGDFGVVCTTGPGGAFFSETDAASGYDYAQMWNDEIAAACRRYPGKVWGSGVAPMQDPRRCVDELQRAMSLGLVGVNVPSTIGAHGRTRIDDASLAEFYAAAEKLGAVLFLHPTDVVFPAICDGYDGALYNSLGKVIEVSIAAYRLVLSGIMERHPGLKVYVSHTGGALPYQAGRMDKNSRAAKLPEDPSVYLRRMYTDTVQPHAPGLKFAIDFYGIDHVMYGDDYPCWNAPAALRIFNEIGLSRQDRQKILGDNARRILNLKEPARQVVAA